MTLEPTPEQLNAITAAVYGPDGAYGGWPTHATARSAWPLIRDMVLESAAKECEVAMGEAQRAEAFLATGFDLGLEQLEYARRKGAEKCLTRIRAMKGKP
jgi:hypothetical protein